MTVRRLAVILAGGRGTRLAPFTAVFPKPLVPIGDIPIIEIIVRQLAASGFNELIFSVGHLAPLIEAYFLSHPLRERGVSITYAREDRPMGTAGSLALLSGLPEAFLVLNGDVLTTLHFGSFLENHEHSGALLTVATHRKQIKLQLGVIECHGQRITNYIEKPTLEHQVSMGVYGYRRSALAYLPKGERFDFPDLVLTLLKNGELVRAYPCSDEWLDIGNPDDYARAQQRVDENPDPYFVGPRS